MKPYLIFLFLDVFLFLGYGLAVLLHIVRRVFSRRTKP